MAKPKKLPGVRARNLNLGTRLWSQRPCTLAWHGAHSVIKFSSASAPEWLRNSVWCSSRFDIVPHN